MSKADLSRARLYGILDLGYVAADRALEVAEQLIAGGIDVLQLRAKQLQPARITAIAESVAELTRRCGIPFIVNDDPGVAARVGAAGVHLGQHDMSLARAREILGADAVVGRSTHSLEQARSAAAEGADYIGFGPLFATPTKPDYVPVGLGGIRAVHEAVSLPVFCIGGIKIDNLAEVVEAGAHRVVIVSGLLLASDVAAATRAAKELLQGGGIRE